jgi:plastocyanin
VVFVDMAAQRVALLSLSLLALPFDVSAVTVSVGRAVPAALRFFPEALTVPVNTRVDFVWNGTLPHNVVQLNSLTCGDYTPGGFMSGATVAQTHQEPHTFSHTFTQTGLFYYECTPHCQSGMRGTIRVQSASTHPVLVAPGNNDPRYDPPNVTIQEGDTVAWDWRGTTHHSVTEADSDTCNDVTSGGFDSGAQKSGTFNHRFVAPGICFYQSTRAQDCNNGMKGAVTVLPPPPPPPPPPSTTTTTASTTATTTGMLTTTATTTGMPVTTTGVVPFHHVEIDVGPVSALISFVPSSVQIMVGQTVLWKWSNTGIDHDVAETQSSTACGDLRTDGKEFRSAIQRTGYFTHNFTEVGTFTYECTLTGHCAGGMKGVIQVVDPATTGVARTPATTAPVSTTDVPTTTAVPTTSSVSTIPPAQPTNNAAPAAEGPSSVSAATSNSSPWMIVGIVAGAAVACCLFFVFVLVLRRRAKREKVPASTDEESSSSEDGTWSTPDEDLRGVASRLDELRKTQKRWFIEFDQITEGVKIGKGSQGSVYSGAWREQDIGNPLRFPVPLSCHSNLSC